MKSKSSLVLVCALLLACASAVSAQSWVATSTQAIGPALLNATSQGALPDSTPIHVNVALQIQNRAALVQYLNAVNTPGNPLYTQVYTQELDPAQFTAAYAPTSAQVQAVANYLQSAGFTNVAPEANNLMIAADGNVAAVRKAFNTQIGSYVVNGQTIFANETAAQIPAQFEGIVGSVLGLNSGAIMTFPMAVNAVSVPNFPGSYRPANLWTAYDVASTPTGSKTPIAIFAEGDVTGVISDLRLAEKNNKLAQVPVTVETVGIPTTDTSGADEFDMDTQYSTGMATTVSHLYIYATTSMSDSDIALEINRFAAQKLARAGSASFGLCEVFAYLDGSMLADDNSFLEAAAQGQTVFASSGDTGSACIVGTGENGVPGDGIPMVEYPASSPYVIGAGSTTLVTNADGTYDTEIAWYAGGGGLSQFEASGYWQEPVNTLSTVGKGVPDVAMDADPNSGVYIWLDGTEQCCYGGTSLSSPLSLGVWARLQSSHANKLGFAGPVLYNGAVGLPSPASPAGFHDITVGANGLYTALPGYDYVTGLGTFDVAAINAAIKK